MNNEYTYNLDAIFDSRNSFYGKAKVNVKEDDMTYSELLYSYGTLVGIYTKDKITKLEQFNYVGKYSQTTTRHQKEFFKQHGLTTKELNILFKNKTLEKNNLC